MPDTVIVNARQVRSGVITAEEIKRGLEASGVRERRKRQDEVRRERERRQAMLLELVDPIVALLTRARRVRGWSIEHLEKEIKLMGNGRLSARSLGLYERGERSPTLDSLRLWSETLGVEITTQITDDAVRQLMR